MRKTSYIIKCPNCAAEYLPSEIFLPKYFFGNNKNIIKSNIGKIVSFSGDELSLKEKYNCDYCYKDFKVFARVAFNCDTKEKYNFDKDYEVPIEQSGIILSED